LCVPSEIGVKMSLQTLSAQVHAKCNSVLHLAQPRVLHSAGGPYITCIAKQMDEGFAGTQLYRQRVCFFLPLDQSVNFGPAQTV
jgi:hypothetical protein